jgi:dihydroorotase
VGEKQRKLSAMDELAESVVAFSDDGVGVEGEAMMEQAMRKAKALGKIIAAHCEDATLVNGGYIHDGEYAKRNGHRGNPSESEWRSIERDLRLAEKTGCEYHVCHVSTKEGVELVRRAKSRGVHVTCETAPHYLLLCDESLHDEGRFRMNPPVRSAQDRAALIAGIADGTVDIIATDHAPHSAEEKSGGLSDSLNGIVGLETAFPVLYTGLVKTGELTLERLLELMQVNPSRRFGIGGQIAVGEQADVTVFELANAFEITSEQFLSQGRATPFEGDTVFGKCLLTLVDGVPAFADRAFCFHDKVEDGE